jgi:hypothetical protein
MAFSIVLVATRCLSLDRSRCQNADVSWPLAKALKDGEVDVILSLGELNTPYIQSLLRDPTVRLMNLTQAEGLARVFPDIIAVGSEPTGNRRSSNSRRKAAAFVRWHEPDDARVSSPDL